MFSFGLAEEKQKNVREGPSCWFVCFFFGCHMPLVSFKSHQALGKLPLGEDFNRREAPFCQQADAC